MASAPKPQDVLAAPPRVPSPTPRMEQAERERKSYIAAREGFEQRSVFRGLVVLAILVLLLSIWRAGLDRVFIHRWWWP